jgi:hypothetical protein
MLMAKAFRPCFHGVARRTLRVPVGPRPGVREDILTAACPGSHCRALTAYRRHRMLMVCKQLPEGGVPALPTSGLAATCCSPARSGGFITGQ